ncbi:MarR family transcriptional regulator [Aciduricibacillus chroicocephali]|uniref:MarR family transcriptional regulator n=1 Tax=Aciduricibacillus chroicocephali TaxID=3054939 RepID=A0ABY9L0M9_9BACI|nr:MarR family transcriptional regulator [Bacillaceae bacterium 44XB]
MSDLNDQDLALKLFVVLSRATESVMKRVEEDIRTYELNTTEFAVLELLYHKGDQPIQKIGDKVLLASSSITYVVDKLEKKGLLTRRRCTEDRRVTYAAITDAGRALMDEIFPKHGEAIQGIFSVLDKDEKEQMIEQLRRLGFHAKGI